MHSLKSSPYSPVHNLMGNEKENGLHSWTRLSIAFFIHTFLYEWEQIFKFVTTFNNGSLGSRIDEERSELRYVM